MTLLTLLDVFLCVLVALDVSSAFEVFWVVESFLCLIESLGVDLLGHKHDDISIMD